MKKIFAVPVLCLFLVACGFESNDSQGQPEIGVVVQPEYAYKSAKYSFALRVFPKNYEVKYLEESGGIAFKKIVKMDPKKNLKNPDIDYTSLIYILPTKNVQGYEDLNDLIAKKYNGYTLRFVDYENVSGVYVDDGLYVEANPHFFTMSGDGDLIYQVDMKLPSRYYPMQKEAFEEVVRSLVIL